MPGRTDGEIRQIVSNFVRSAHYSETAFGFLGEPIGGGRYNFASARVGYVKARLMQNDQVTGIIDVLNTKAPIDPRIRLVIGKNISDEWEVIEVDATYIAQFLADRPGMGVGPHSHRLGYGLEDYLEPRRFEPGLVRVYDQTMTVRVLPYSYTNSSGNPAYYAGGTLDLTAYRPTTAARWRWAKIGIDPATGSLIVATGADALSASALTSSDLYAIALDGIPLAGVKLKTGMTAIDEEQYFSDCRVWHSGGGDFVPAHTHDAADVASGTLDVARIPDITADKIDSGAAAAGEALIADGIGGAAWGSATRDYIKLSHTLPNNTAGGSTVSGSWQTRPINTEDSDDSNICTLSANEFTLAAGTYDLFASGVFYNDSNFQRMRLYNVDDATTLILGETLRYGQTGLVTIQHTLRGRFTLSAAKTLRLEYRIGTARATDGLGIASNYGVDEIYAIIEMWRTA